jgi:hypothetical protein
VNPAKKIKIPASPKLYVRALKISGSTRGVLFREITRRCCIVKITKPKSEAASEMKVHSGHPASWPWISGKSSKPEEMITYLQDVKVKKHTTVAKSRCVFCDYETDFYDSYTTKS